MVTAGEIALGVLVFFGFFALLIFSNDQEIQAKAKKKEDAERAEFLKKLQS